MCALAHRTLALFILGSAFDTTVEYLIMSLGTILLILLVLVLIGIIPAWPHSRGWGYGPSGIVGVILLVLLVLFLMGRI